MFHVVVLLLVWKVRVSETNFKADEQIFSFDRIKCFNDECSNRALMLFAGNWWCGECIAKYNVILNKKKSNYLMETLKEN